MAEWLARGLTPTATIDDRTFLRRIYLDLAGTVPPPETVHRFVASVDSNKRARIAAELVASDEFARHMADRWDDILLGPAVRAGTLDRGAFRRWLELQFKQNRPYDQLVRELITATGKSSGGGPLGLADYGGGAARGAQEAEEGVNGAANWMIRYSRRPQDLAGETSRIFLGVKVQCAQCHDHKTEAWTTDDFRAFTAAFARVQARPVGPRTRGTVRALALSDGSRAPRFWRRDEDLQRIAETTPRALDGTVLDADDRRQALAQWMTDRDNPWFSRAIVNRVWAQMLGTGFVQPIDDFRPSNPAVMEPLLDALAEGFEASGYDLQKLYQTIAASAAYQRSSFADPAEHAQPTFSDARDNRWSRFQMRPMPPSVLVRSVIDASNLEPVIERLSRGDTERLKLQLVARMSFVFDADSEANPDDQQGTIAQALVFLNGREVAGASSLIPTTALADAMSAESADARIDRLYVRALGRSPSPDERTYWKNFIDSSDYIDGRPAARAQAMQAREQAAKARSKGSLKQRLQRTTALERRTPASRADSATEQAYEDLFWTLLNSSEFYLNH